MYISNHKAGIALLTLIPVSGVSLLGKLDIDIDVIFTVECRTVYFQNPGKSNIYFKNYVSNIFTYTVITIV